MVRHGTPGGVATREVMADIEIHLSGMRQAERRLVRAVRARTSPSRCSGCARGGVRRQPGGDVAVEIVARGHTNRLSFVVVGRASASSAARSAPIARWSRDRAVPCGTPSTSAVSSRESPR